MFFPIEVVPDIALGIPANMLGHVLEQQGNHCQRHMGIDAVHYQLGCASQSQVLTIPTARP